MPAIAKHNDVITVIIIFSVEPERQQELVDTIIEFVETAVKYQRSFSQQFPIAIASSSKAVPVPSARFACLRSSL